MLVLLHVDLTSFVQHQIPVVQMLRVAAFVLQLHERQTVRTEMQEDVLLPQLPFQALQRVADEHGVANVRIRRVAELVEFGEALVEQRVPKVVHVFGFL